MLCQISYYILVRPKTYMHLTVVFSELKNRYQMTLFDKKGKKEAEGTYPQDCECDLDGLRLLALRVLDPRDAWFLSFGFRPFSDGLNDRWSTWKSLSSRGEREREMDLDLRGEQ